MASTRLHRTPSSSSNQVKWTWSGWIKKSTNDASGCLFCAFTDVNNYTELDAGSNQIDYYNVTGGGVDARLTTSAYLNDPTAWYHIVVVWDTANVTADDRMKVYINGVDQTEFSARSNPSSSLNSTMNSTAPQEIGARAIGSTTFFNGLMAHVHFCDGYAYAASDFGETDSTSGIWVANSAPSVSYGTNGYFLKFASGASGTDSSGQGNNMTVVGNLTNNKDNPDNNFATWNPLYMPHTGVDPVFSNGNTTVVTQDNASDYLCGFSTLGMSSGKWYAEFKAVTTNNYPIIGITQSPMEHQYNEDWLGNDLYDYGYIYNGNTVTNGVADVGWGAGYSAGDIVMVAVDLDNNKLYFGTNGTWANSGDPTSGATGTGALSITSIAASTPGVAASGWYHFACSDQGTGPDTVDANFGNGYFGTTAVSTSESDDAGIGSFEYDVPAGYYTLCTNNLGDQS